MELYIDKDSCLGCGMCVQMAPDIFVLSDSKTASIIKQPADMTDEVLTAIEFCPGAIQQR